MWNLEQTCHAEGANCTLLAKENSIKALHVQTHTHAHTGYRAQTHPNRAAGFPSRHAVGTNCAVLSCINRMEHKQSAAGAPLIPIVSLFPCPPVYCIYLLSLLLSSACFRGQGPPFVICLHRA